MKVKMILPALTEAVSPFFRPIKYSLFPPLGLATLAGYVHPRRRGGAAGRARGEAAARRRAGPGGHPGLHHVGEARLRAGRPLPPQGRLRRDRRAARRRRCREEAARHADSVFLGPGEDTWPAFLGDLSRGTAAAAVPLRRAHAGPRCRRIRRDLIKRHLYLVPNSIVVSRGCPHSCDFCYKEAFFEGGRGFYTQKVDAALAEIERLPGRHLYFLDDHLFGDVRFASALFDGMRGMGRLWQAAGTVQSVLAAAPAGEGRGVRPAQPVRRLRDAEPATHCARRASSRTCTATTGRPCGGCTTWA